MSTFGTWLLPWGLSTVGALWHANSATLGHTVTLKTQVFSASVLKAWRRSQPFGEDLD